MSLVLDFPGLSGNVGRAAKGSSEVTRCFWKVWLQFSRLLPEALSKSVLRPTESVESEAEPSDWKSVLKNRNRSDERKQTVIIYLPKNTERVKKVPRCRFLSGGVQNLKAKTLGTLEEDGENTKFQAQEGPGSNGNQKRRKPPAD